RKDEKLEVKQSQEEEEEKGSKEMKATGRKQVREEEAEMSTVKKMEVDISRRTDAPLCMYVITADSSHPCTCSPTHHVHDGISWRPRAHRGRIGGEATEDREEGREETEGE
ncbi:hypothetical protein Pcinc_029415, partial [Petrolisthes cinctipes]